MTLTSRSLSKGDSENKYPVWITGAEALMDSLNTWGKVIFGYPGGAILPIYDAVHKAEKDGWLKHMVRHEQGSSHAADGYARSTGEVGVCFGTSGPGHQLSYRIATARWSVLYCCDWASSKASYWDRCFQRPIFWNNTSNS